ncbi:MAG: class I SAM-dependent methyltransferase [Epsilonproteobacteria bacterium]|nr:class I SAM-dependent methyltransferase [Campylobacterota bacterium]
MAKYHKYVFDVEKREFIGDFETMYRDESKDNFDSWHQDDSRQLQRRIALAILDDYNFNTILDLGSGKGSLTHLLKRKNNHVVGVDISQTAVDIARERFPDIEFKAVDLNSIEKYRELVSGGVELIFTSELLSYIKNWRELLDEISKTAKYLMVSLFIPDNPIGFIKSERELLEHIESSFNIIEHVTINRPKFVIIFAEGRC